MIRLALGVAAALVLAPAASAESALFADRYDRAIRRAVATWWPQGPHWHWWKAQLWQESRLRPDARSPVGAAGIAQFMPATWREVAVQLGIDPKRVPPTAAEPAIEAGAWYMARLARQWRGWSGSADAGETHRHAQAGYNAGSGNVRRAWRMCGEPVRWELTAVCLPEVTGRHAAETVTYVGRIARWRAMLASRP
jgi:soluble lytic murein transglycosylase-like protein